MKPQYPMIPWVKHVFGDYCPSCDAVKGKTEHKLYCFHAKNKKP